MLWTIRIPEKQFRANTQIPVTVRYPVPINISGRQHAWCTACLRPLTVAAPVGDCCSLNVHCRDRETFQHKLSRASWIQSTRLHRFPSRTILISFSPTFPRLLGRLLSRFQNKISYSSRTCALNVPFTTLNVITLIVFHEQLGRLRSSDDVISILFTIKSPKSSFDLPSLLLRNLQFVHYQISDAFTIRSPVS